LRIPTRRSAQPAHHLARAAAVDGQAHQLARGVAHLPPAALVALGDGVRLRLGGGSGGVLGARMGISNPPDPGRAASALLATPSEILRAFPMELDE
jgi:hypothetical protein